MNYREDTATFFLDFRTYFLRSEMINKASAIKEQNIGYYNVIAAHYNQILDNDPLNEKIREKVAARFKSLIPSGTILDFGGGTGKDLGWMSDQQYTVLFCEPSFKMRALAVDYNETVLQNNKITFFEEYDSDFNTWTKGHPFAAPVDGVLSNFAVLNCIPDIGPLFKGLSFAVKKGGHMLALVLDSRFKKVMDSNFRSAVRNVLFNTPIHINVQFKEVEQVVYLHTLSEFKKASAPYFNLYIEEEFFEFNFMLLHLTRK